MYILLETDLDRDSPLPPLKAGVAQLCGVLQHIFESGEGRHAREDILPGSGTSLAPTTTINQWR